MALRTEIRCEPGAVKGLRRPLRTRQLLRRVEIREPRRGGVSPRRLGAEPVSPRLQALDGQGTSIVSSPAARGPERLDSVWVASLHRAVGDKRTRIEPRYQIGQGDSRCLVGFLLVSKSFAKDVLP